MEAEEAERRARAAEKLRQLEEKAERAAREREEQERQRKLERERTFQQAQEALAAAEQAPEPTLPASATAPVPQPVQLQQRQPSTGRAAEVVPAPAPQKPAWAQPLYRGASATAGEDPCEIATQVVPIAAQQNGAEVGEEKDSQGVERSAHLEEHAGGEWGGSESRGSVLGGRAGSRRGRGDASGVRGSGGPRGGRHAAVPARPAPQTRSGSSNNKPEGVAVGKQKESAEALAAAAVASAARRLQGMMLHTRSSSLPAPTPLAPPPQPHEGPPTPPAVEEDPAVSLPVDAVSSPPRALEAKSSASNLFLYRPGLEVQPSVHDTPHTSNVMDGFEVDEPATGATACMGCLHVPFHILPPLSFTNHCDHMN
jgi:hypothetical protein